MKKLTIILLLLMLASACLTGCSGQSSPEGVPADAAETAGKKDGGATLAEIRKAAEDAGYNVTDEYQAAFMKDVVGGFTVQVVADNKDMLYSILECETEDAAVKNATDIDDAGDNISVRNGRILGCYDVETKDGDTKDIITSIVMGKPIANK